MSELRGRILGALRLASKSLCDDCLAIKLTLGRADLLAAVRALEAEEPPVVLVYPGLCSLCGRVQRVMRAWQPRLTTQDDELRCPVCGASFARREGVAVADDHGLTHVHLECLVAFRARRRRGAEGPA